MGTGVPFTALSASLPGDDLDTALRFAQVRVKVEAKEPWWPCPPTVPPQRDLGPNLAWLGPFCSSSAPPTPRGGAKSPAAPRVLCQARSAARQLRFPAGLLLGPVLPPPPRLLPSLAFLSLDSVTVLVTL